MSILYTLLYKKKGKEMQDGTDREKNNADLSEN
jgi:hypothetical protein